MTDRDIAVKSDKPLTNVDVYGWLASLGGLAEP